MKKTGQPTFFLSHTLFVPERREMKRLARFGGDPKIWWRMAEDGGGWRRMAEGS